MDNRTSFALFIAGSIFFPCCFFMVLKWLRKTATGSEFKKRYQLSDKDCGDISIKLISTLQALLASITGLIVCSKCFEDVLYCTHPVVLTYAFFGGPYFIYDAMAMFYVSTISDKHYKNVGKPKNKKNLKGLLGMVKQFCTFVSKSPVIIIHHVIMAPIGFSIITHFRGVRGDFFVGVMYLMEASTPFVSFRSVLSKLQMKHTFLYKLNGALMLITFPLFRIVSILYTVGLYAEQQGIDYFETFSKMDPRWLFVFVASLAPQIYWYYLMLNGLFKIVFKSHSDENLKSKDSYLTQTQVTKTLQNAH